MSTDTLKQRYQKTKELLAKVLDSPKPYLDDVRSILKELWMVESQIIRNTGTIYNGL